MYIQHVQHVHAYKYKQLEVNLIQYLLNNIQMGERVLYDDLRKGRKGYVCDKTLMANITKDDTDEQAKMKLVGVITSIFKNSGIVIRSLYIGKSYLDKKGTTTSDEEDNDNSFDDKQLKGVKSRWHHHAKQYYGKRGLIVIEIITADKVPNEKQGHERHCLDLEEKLIEYYQNQINPALKIANPKKYSEGKKAKKDYKASVLYIAFNTSTSMLIIYVQMHVLHTYTCNQYYSIKLLICLYVYETLMLYVMFYMF